MRYWPGSGCESGAIQCPHMPIRRVVPGPSENSPPVHRRVREENEARAVGTPEASNRPWFSVRYTLHCKVIYDSLLLVCSSSKAQEAA